MAMQQREPARDLARGKWHGLLGRWLDDRAIAGKHTKCPMCGGTDRFRMDDKDGAGTWICSHCGAGDGFHLLQNLGGFTFQEAAQYVERECGKIHGKAVTPGRSEEDVRADLRRVWGEAKRISEGDAAWSYLAARCGITSAPMGLRFHPDLAYFHDDGKTTRHPSMLAQVIGADGAPVSIHRTYLTADGKKAELTPPRKLMTPIRKLENVAVRLAAPDDGWLGIAEGIETALCASRKHAGMPVWAAVSAGLLKSFRPPDGVKFLAIYGDADWSYTGQAAAYELARSCTTAGIECRVMIPAEMGTDWADD